MPLVFCAYTVICLPHRAMPHIRSGFHAPDTNADGSCGLPPLHLMRKDTGPRACSALNTACRSTFIRPAASLSAEAGFITSTARIRKNRQGNQGLTRQSLPFDYCLALLAAALSSSHFRSLEDRWESLKAEECLQIFVQKNSASHFSISSIHASGS